MLEKAQAMNNFEDVYEYYKKTNLQRKLSNIYDSHQDSLAENSDYIKQAVDILGTKKYKHIDRIEKVKDLFENRSLNEKEKKAFNEVLNGYTQTFRQKTKAGKLKINHNIVDSFGVLKKTYELSNKYSCRPRLPVYEKREELEDKTLETILSFEYKPINYESKRSPINERGLLINYVLDKETGKDVFIGDLNDSSNDSQNKLVQDRGFFKRAGKALTNGLVGLVAAGIIFTGGYLCASKLVYEPKINQQTKMISQLNNKILENESGIVILKEENVKLSNKINQAEANYEKGVKELKEENKRFAAEYITLASQLESKIKEAGRPDEIVRKETLEEVTSELDKKYSALLENCASKSNQKENAIYDSPDKTSFSEFAKNMYEQFMGNECENPAIITTSNTQTINVFEDNNTAANPYWDSRINMLGRDEVQTTDDTNNIAWESRMALQARDEVQTTDDTNNIAWESRMAMHGTGNEAKKIKRLVDKNYKFLEYPGYLLNKSGEYWCNCQPVEAGFTLIGAGLSTTNEAIGRIVEEPVKVIGATSRTIEEARLLERIPLLFGIKKPYETAIKKNSQNSLKKGAKDAEETNDFVFRNIGPLPPFIFTSGPNWNKTHAEGLEWVMGGFLGEDKGLLHFDTNNDRYVLEDGWPGAVIQGGSDASWLIYGNNHGGGHSHESKKGGWDTIGGPLNDNFPTSAGGPVN